MTAGFEKDTFGMSNDIAVELEGIERIKSQYLHPNVELERTITDAKRLFNKSYPLTQFLKRLSNISELRDANAPTSETRMYSSPVVTGVLVAVGLYTKLYPEITPQALEKSLLEDTLNLESHIEDLEVDSQSSLVQQLIEYGQQRIGGEGTKQEAFELVFAVEHRLGVEGDDNSQLLRAGFGLGYHLAVTTRKEMGLESQGSDWDGGAVVLFEAAENPDGNDAA